MKEDNAEVEKLRDWLEVEVCNTQLPLLQMSMSVLFTNNQISNLLTLKKSTQYMNSYFTDVLNYSAYDAAILATKNHTTDRKKTDFLCEPSFTIAPIGNYF